MWLFGENNNTGRTKGENGARDREDVFVIKKEGIKAMGLRLEDRVWP